MADILTMLWLVIISWFLIEVINSRLSRARRGDRPTSENDNKE